MSKGSKGAGKFVLSQAKFWQWWVAKNPVLRFAYGFVLVIAIFYVITVFPPFHTYIFKPYLHFIAVVSSAILNMLGYNTQALAGVVRTEEFSISIARGCDAVEPSIIFLASVLAFPSPMRIKWPGILLGIFALMLLNFVRVITLFITGVHYPDMFEIMHIEVWQVVFLILAIVFFFLWLKWAVKQQGFHELQQTTA